MYNPAPHCLCTSGDRCGGPGDGQPQLGGQSRQVSRFDRLIVEYPDLPVSKLVFRETDLPHYCSAILAKHSFLKSL